MCKPNNGASEYIKIDGTKRRNRKLHHYKLEILTMLSQQLIDQTKKWVMTYKTWKIVNHLSLRHL